jgi:hypothetical protein
MLMGAPWRHIAIGLAIAAALVFARCHWERLTRAQSPPVLFDSNVYKEITARPLAVALLFSAKPLTVPLAYRVIGSEPTAIARVQGELAFAAWALLTLALALALRRWPARVAAVVIGIAFLLAPPRVGWSGVVLSESLDDTLRTLVIACAIGLATTERRSTRRALVIAFAGAGLAWLFARDTNAIAALVALASAALVWPASQWWTTRRWAIALAATTVAASLVSLWSTGVVSDPLPFQQHWALPLTSRAGYPLIDNLVVRMMPDDRAWLAERGAPVDDLARFSEPQELVQDTPEHAPAQSWIVAHGQATYLRWLARHPLDRLLELIDARWTVLAGSSSMMPIGWSGRDSSHPVLSVLRRLTRNHVILLVLIAASPLLLLAPRRRPLTGIALCLITSGTVAAAAAYYGDAAEYPRHCYGAGQQIVLGLFLALLAWLDVARRELPWRRALGDSSPPAPGPRDPKTANATSCARTPAA